MVFPRSSSAPNDQRGMKIYEEIGSGSFGKVYRAYDPTLKQVVAIKMIQLDASGDLDNFLLELRFLRELKCKHITQVLSSALHDSVLWVSMEYCDAGSCTHLLRRCGTFSEKAAVYVIHEALLGLAYIHEQRKIHRDLKSANILVTGQGDVKIADFGVSAQLSDQIPLRDTFMGTPYWMAPEVIIGEKYGTAVDIWSLGIVAIELITGTPPLRKYQPNEVIRMIQSGPAPQLPAACGASSNFRGLVSLCLQKQPHHRPSAEELLENNVFRGYRNTFAGSNRYMPRPPEFQKMVARVVRQRKTASLQNPVGTRTAADLVDLAPTKTFHSRDQRAGRQTNSNLTEEETDWDFNTKYDALPRGVPSRMVLPFQNGHLKAISRGIPGYPHNGLPVLSSPESDGLDQHSDSPEVSPISEEAKMPSPPPRSPLKFWNRRKSRKSDKPPSESPPPPPVPKRNKDHLRQPVMKAKTPLEQPAKMKPTVPFQVVSPLAPRHPNQPAYQQHASSAIPVAAQRKTQQSKLPPKPTAEPSEHFNSHVRGALLNTERRAIWPSAAERIMEFRQEFEDIDMELPGFTRTLLEELFKSYREAHHSTIEKSQQEQQQAQQRAQPEVQQHVQARQACRAHQVNAHASRIPVNQSANRFANLSRYPVSNNQGNHRGNRAKESRI